MLDWAREKGYRLRIARKCKGSISKPNNKYWKQSRSKIVKERSRESRDISMRDWTREKGCRLGIAQVVYLGQIKNIGSGRMRKL